MMQDKYRHLIEEGNIVQDRDNMRYEVISIAEDGLSMKLREVREDASEHIYNCNAQGSKKIWIVAGNRSEGIENDEKTKCEDKYLL